MLYQRRCLPVFVPTDHYRHAESLSGWLTKRLARTSSGGGETVTLANRDGTGGNHGKRDIDVQYKEVNLRTGVWNEAAWGRQWGTEHVQRQEEGRAERHQDEGDGDDEHQGQGDELRDWVVDIGHSAHQGVEATKRQLRVRLLFPGMDRVVEHLPAMPSQRQEQGQGPPETNQGAIGAVVKAVHGPLGPHPGRAAHPSRHRRAHQVPRGGDRQGH